MERIDELTRGGFRLIQDTDYFCFGTDAVLLADFAKARKGQRVIDLCAGNGVISLLMLERCQEAHYEALELQGKLCDLAKRSVKLNEVSDRVRVIQGDVRDIASCCQRGVYDVVTVNPPYSRGQTLKNESSAVRLARHEETCSLRDVCEAAAYLLKYHGHLYMVHRPSRLAEIFEELARVHLEPKKMQLVYPFADREPSQVLIDASLSGGRELRVLPPLVVYEQPGVYTKQMLEVYGEDGHHSSV